MNKAALGALTGAEGPEEFAAGWRRMTENFTALLKQPEDVSALRKTILSLAIRGRLITQINDTPITNPVDSRISLSGATSNVLSINLPKHWTWRRLSDVVHPKFPISYGVLVPGPDVTDGVPFVRIQDLSINTAAPAPGKRISRDAEQQYSRTRLVGGELLLAVVGATIGKIGIAPQTWAGANIARAVCRIMPSPLIDVFFLSCVLQSDLIQTYFTRSTRTLAQPTLNVAMIKDTPIPLPPLAEQKRIVARVHELMALCDDLEARLRRAEEGARKLAEALVAEVLR
jgi:type I restriction enzyme S subunit